jgi:exopolysaccharide biosynthesis polyprenyl glycosylphosphotransferase
MTPPPEQYVIAARPRAVRVLPHPPRIISVTASIASLELVVLASLSLFVVARSSALPLGPLAALALLGLSAPLRRRQPLKPDILSDAVSIFQRSATAFTLAAGLVLLRGGADVFATFATAAGGLLLLLLARLAARWLQQRQAHVGVLTPTLIVGSGPAATQILEILHSDPSYGLRPLGIVRNAGSSPERGPAARSLGGIEHLVELVRYRGVGTVVVAFDSTEKDPTPAALRLLLQEGVDVWVVPRFFELGAEIPAHHIGGIPVVRLRPALRWRFGWRLKRALDVAIATLALLGSAPLLAVIAAAIKLDSRGSVLFRQERVGREGRHFEMFKFRTMKPCSTLREQTEWEPQESRITRVGRLLRATSLDELPQLLNVLRGDLALVGPRPERPAFVRLFQESYDGYRHRHRVPGGITGWAQIHGLRGNTSISDRARFDNHYIENWSLGSDLKILLLTPRTFLKRNGHRGADNSDERSGEANNLVEVR